MSIKLTSVVCLAAAVAAGCATVSEPTPAPAVPMPAPVAPILPAPSPEDGQAAALFHRQSVLRLPPAEITRERNRLAAVAVEPAAQLRLAMLLAQPRSPNADLARALALTELVLKSADPAAVSLHPLAWLLAEQLAERLRLEGLGERQSAQLKESQRRVGELQEKLERLANIERSLPGRPLPHGRTP